MTFSRCLPIFGDAIAPDLGPGLGLIRLRRSASLRAGRKAATPTRSSSYAAPAATIPTWITATSHPSFSGSADLTRQVSRHMRSILSCATGGSRLVRLAGRCTIPAA